MTVRDLLKELAEFPPDAEVWLVGTAYGAYNVDCSFEREAQEVWKNKKGEVLIS